MPVGAPAYWSPCWIRPSIGAAGRRFASFCRFPSAPCIIAMIETRARTTAARGGTMTREEVRLTRLASCAG